MTTDAKAVWKAFYNEWASCQAAVEGATAAAFAKLEGGAARLALLHHVVSHVGAVADDCDPIEPDSVRAGITLAKWFAFESQRIYVALAETEDAGLTRRLIDFIRQHGGKMTARTLHKSNKPRYPTTDVAEAALNTLVDAGLAAWEDAPAGPKGGRPTRRLVLKDQKPHPDADDMDDEGDTDNQPRNPETRNPPPHPRGVTETTEGVLPRNPPRMTPKPSRVVKIPLFPRVSGFRGFGVRPSTPTRRTLQATPAATTRRKAVRGFRGVVFARCGRGQDITRRRRVHRQPTKPTQPRRVVPWPGRRGGVLRHRPRRHSMAQAAVEESGVIGLDTETTGLNPRTDRVRLLQLATDRGTFLVDCFLMGAEVLAPLFESLAERPVVIQNAAFDLSMLGAIGFVPGAVHCIRLLSILLHGTRRPRGFHGLAQIAERELDRRLDKAEQKSDWSGELTAEQLAYAAADASILLPLFETMTAKVKAACMARAVGDRKPVRTGDGVAGRAGHPFRPCRMAVAGRRGGAGSGGFRPGDWTRRRRPGPACWCKMARGTGPRRSRLFPSR